MSNVSRLSEQYLSDSQLSFVAFSVELLVSECTSLGRLDRSQGAHWVCLLCPHCESAGLGQNNIGMMRFRRKFLCRMPTCFSCSVGDLFGKLVMIFLSYTGHRVLLGEEAGTLTLCLLLQHHLMSSCCGDKKFELRCLTGSKGIQDTCCTCAGSLQCGWCLLR